jgi:hypothetical protein
VVGPKRTKATTLLIVLATLGGLLGIVLAAIAACLCARWRGRRSISPASGPPPLPPAAPPSNKDGKGAAAAAAAAAGDKDARELRIRVQHPTDAANALRQHHVDGAIAEMPWAPQTAV